LVGLHHFHEGMEETSGQADPEAQGREQGGKADPKGAAEGLTMNRAVVIKTVGDPEIAGAIVDGITPKVIPLNTDELKAVRAEYARLQARNAIRSYGDSLRWQDVKQALAVKYAIPHHGRLYNAILIAWAGLWLFIYGWFDYFSEWNREA